MSGKSAFQVDSSVLLTQGFLAITSLSLFHLPNAHMLPRPTIIVSIPAWLELHLSRFGSAATVDLRSQGLI